MDIIKLDEKRLVNRIKKGKLESLVTWVNVMKLIFSLKMMKAKTENILNQLFH